MALVVFLQEDEDVPSVYRNLKIICETAPCIITGLWTLPGRDGFVVSVSASLFISFCLFWV